MKIILTWLFVCATIFATNAQNASEYNKNFKSRFEYVTSFFDYVTDYDEDFPLSLNVIEKESRRLNFVVIGMKELFQVIHNEPFKTKDQFYFSVCKIFLRDTLYVDKDKYQALEQFAVDKDSLNYFNRFTLSEVVSKYTIDGHLRYDGNKRERALMFYFDRRFYPITDPANKGYIVNLKYDFPRSNITTIYRGKQAYSQLWDKYGNLIWESSED